MFKKQYFFVLLLCCILVPILSHGQNSIIQRIVKKDTNLVVQKNTDWKKYITAIALDKQSHISYLISYYGEVIDSARLTNDDFQLVITKKVNLFDYYKALADKLINVTETAKLQIRNEGTIKPGWEYGKAISEIPKLDSAVSRLEKVIEMDKLIEYQFVLNYILKSNIPAYYQQHIKTYPSYAVTKFGTLNNTKDSTIYYNLNNKAALYKAKLDKRKAFIFYYNREEKIVDSLSLEPTRIDGLLKEKTDVFTLYKAWLETQKRSILGDLKYLDQVNRNTGIGLDVRYAAEIKRMDKVREEILQEDRVLNNKLVYSIKPDVGNLASLMEQGYPTETPVNQSLLRVLEVPFSVGYYSGTKRYELTDHLGNVRVVISDNRSIETSGGSTYYKPDVINSQDYYAFGGQMPNRSYILGGESYRYGFNGKENDNEVKGEGNQQDYGMRIYDPRIGKFLSVDPITKDYPMLTPYQFASNRPIDGIDQDGLEWKQYRPWFKGEEKAGPVLAFFANATANTVLGVVNAVAGTVIGTKELAVYSYKAFTKQRDFGHDVHTTVNGVSSSVSNYLNKPVGEQVRIAGKALTSPEAYGTAVGFLSFGGGKYLFAEGWGAEAALVGTTAPVVDAYAPKAFEKIIEGAKNITKKGSTETSLLVEGSAQEAFGNLMAKYGKTVDDLIFQANEEGGSYRFNTKDGVFNIYNQNSKGAGEFVDLTVSKLEKVGKKTITTKVRFTKD